MKVLILTPNYPQKGAETSGIFIHQQVKALQALGVECHVLMVYNWYPPLGLHKHHEYWRRGHRDRSGHFEEYEGIRIHSVPMYIKMPTRIFPESYYDLATRSLVNYIKKNKDLQGADWIYAHFLTDMGYIATLMKKYLNIRVAAIARGDDVHAWPESKPELVKNLQYCYKHANLMLANNQRLAKDALKYATEPKPDFGVVYNGINYQEIEWNISAEKRQTLKTSFGLPAKKNVMLAIGRSEYLKGWDELLNAVAKNKMLMKDWVLLVITNLNGKGIYHYNIPGKVEELGLGEQVIVKDYMPFDKIKNLYNAADVFILPSYNEGISNAVMEAMASGLWTIASDVGGHSEIMEDGKSGFLVQPRSVDDVSKALQYMFEHFETRKDEVRKSARLAMEKLGDFKTNAAHLLDMFTKQI